MKKGIKIIVGFLVAVILATTGVIFGMYMSERNNLEDSKKSTVTKIAVVNADNGIMKNKENINYASSLMSFPNEDFELVGFNDAKVGLQNGKYAAYILIPSNFSEALNSINTVPVKAQVTYEMNGNLRNDVEVKTINDIHNFILELSNNVSYVYVDSIIGEVHDVQDSAGIIMKNDKLDLERLLRVNADKLISDMDYYPIEFVDKDLNPLDLSKSYETASNAAEKITTNYSDSVTKAVEDLAKIKEKSTNISDEFTKGADGLANSNPFKDEGKVDDMIDGINDAADELANGIDKSKALSCVSNNSISRNFAYNMDDLPGSASENKVTSENRIRYVGECMNKVGMFLQNEQYGVLAKVDPSTFQDYAQAVLSINQVVSDNSVAGPDDKLKLTDSDYAQLYNLYDFVENTKVQITDADLDSLEFKTNEKNEYNLAVDTVIKSVRLFIQKGWLTEAEYSGLSGASVKLYYYLEKIRDTASTKVGGDSGVGDSKQARALLARAMDELGQHGKETYNAIQEIGLNSDSLTNMNDKIKDTIDSISKAFADGAESFGSLGEDTTKAIEEFMKLLTDYDALKYMDEDEQQKYLKELYDAILEMEKSITDQDSEYMEYVLDVNENAVENATGMQENIDDKNEETKGNIEAAVDKLQKERGKINSYNTGVLTDITKKLPYTRLGTLDYTQVYDFITDPVESNFEKSVKVSNLSTLSMDMVTLMKIMGIAAAAVLLLGGLALLISNAATKKKASKE